MAEQSLTWEAERYLVYRARWGSTGAEWAVWGEESGQWRPVCRSEPPSPRGEREWRKWEEVDWTRLAPMVLPLGAWMFATRVAAAGAEKYASMYRSRRLDQRWQVLTLVAWKKCWKQSKRAAPKTNTAEASATATVTTRGAKRRARKERRRREESLERKEALIEQLAKEQEHSRLRALARHQRRLRTGQEAAVLTILQNQISHARREFRQETRAVQRERRELERDRQERGDA